MQYQRKQSCWQGECQNCMHGQRLQLILEESKLVTYKQWEAVYIPCQNKDLDCDLQNTDKPSEKLIKKLHISSTEIPVGKVLEDFQSRFPKVVTHVNVKKIQSKEFQLDKDGKTKCVLQIDYAMVYQCEGQDETQSALWSRSSVNLFTCALTKDEKTRAMVMCADYKG